MVEKKEIDHRNIKALAMASINEQILRTTKEIIVKFIECGRISPTGFHETFRSVYQTVEKTVKGSTDEAEPENDSGK